MIVKMFKSNKQPIKRAFNYLLNQRVNDNTAKLLKGNRELAESLEKLSTAKTKYFSGVLSFAEREKRFTEEEKMEIIEAFEKTFCPDDYLRERLNFTWIQHTDKKRLELNFVVNSTFRNDPDKLLKDKKEFYHWHKPQIKRFDAFRDFIDAKYGLASVHDNGSQHIFTMPDYQIKSRDDVETLVEMVLRANMKSNSKLIESRSELIDGMKKFNINVSRETKGSISVLPEGSKKPIRIKIPENADASVFDEMREKIKEKYDGSSSIAAETKQKHQQRSLSLLERYNNKYKERLQNDYYINAAATSSTTTKTQPGNQVHIGRDRQYTQSNAAATATISVDRKAGIEGLDDINVQFGLERNSKELGRLFQRIVEQEIFEQPANAVEYVTGIYGDVAGIYGDLARRNKNDLSRSNELSKSVGRFSRMVERERLVAEEKEEEKDIENIMKDEATDKKEAFRAAIDELKKEYYENKNELNLKSKDLRKQIYSNKRRFEYVNKIVDDINKEIKELKMNFPSSTTSDKPVDQMSESEFRDWFMQNQLQSSKEAQEKYFQYALKLQKLQATLRKREDELVELAEMIEYQETELNSFKTQKNLMRIEFIKNCQKTYEDKFKSEFTRKQAYEYRPY